MKKYLFKAILLILFSHLHNDSLGKNILVGKTKSFPFSEHIFNVDLTSVQCKAIAKSTKKRCKNKTANPSGYCRVHGG